jgi:demethylmenaquinone methyltransferase/2-methoxy-6-polyprenyl-1,4-benzoquinol methylase
MSNDPIPDAAEVQAIFDRIAPVYDQLNQELSWGLHQVWKMMAVKWAEPQAGDRGLDLCCGSGDLTQILARFVGKTGEVIGLDFSVEQLAIAHHRHQTHCPQLPLQWLQGDALALPFANDYFDCVTMGYGLRNVLDIPRCLQEISRVLKPGAKAAILDFHRPSQPWLQAFQQWYLRSIVTPAAARWGLSEEYAYINPSLERFPSGEAQVRLAYQAGFTRAIHYPLAGGMMGVLVLN